MLYTLFLLIGILVFYREVREIRIIFFQFFRYIVHPKEINFDQRKCACIIYVGIRELNNVYACAFDRVEQRELSYNYN